MVHVYADAAPGAGFEPVEPDLEDVYFAVITGRWNPGPHAAPDAAQQQSA